MYLNPNLPDRKFSPCTYEVDIEKISEYVEVIGDDNPYYSDQEFVKSSKYGQLIAPPTFAVVYSIAALQQLFGDPDFVPLVPRILHAEQEFEFGTIVKAGDTITTSINIESVFEKKNRTGNINEFILISTNSTNQNGDWVCSGLATLIIRGKF